MKKLLSGLVLASLFMFLAMGVTGNIAHAANAAKCGSYYTTSTCNKADVNGDGIAGDCVWNSDLSKCQEGAPTISVMTALNRVANWLFAILLVAAVIYVIIGAFNFFTSEGDPEKVKKARDNVMYALVGVAVAALAKGLVALVKMIVGA